MEAVLQLRVLLPSSVKSTAKLTRTASNYYQALAFKIIKGSASRLSYFNSHSLSDTPGIPSVSSTSKSWIELHPITEGPFNGGCAD